MFFNWIDTKHIIILLGVIVTIPGLSLAVYGIHTWLTGVKKFSERLDQYVATEDQFANHAPESRIIQREIKGSLFNRTVIRGGKKILQFLGRFTPAKMAVDMEHKLTIAGNPGNLSAGGFFGLRFLMLVGGVLLAFLVNRDFGNINMTSLGFGMLIILICLMLPGAWLNSRVRTRQDEITRGLPDALDMLSVCASAGLGFDQSLQKISNYWENELGREFKIVTQEMEMGISRSAALKSMSNRLDVDDLSRFVAIIVQAETIGMSYADVLHSQALQLRVLRQLRAREIANKLPGKMIFPLALFIFPAIIAVILGPSIPVFMNLF
jgi:tight adherence protein C